MSLYTFSYSNHLPAIKQPGGLKMEASDDVSLLSILGNMTTGEVIKRFTNNNLAFVAWLNDVPAAFGWMARSTARIGELNHEFILPRGNRYLWNFRTLAPFRGLGLYPALLQYILQHGDPQANRFWIVHAPENKASLKGIQKAGFVFVGKLYTTKSHSASIEPHQNPPAFREELDFMGIAISGQMAASCWNCSSPYLKKRMPVCCCLSNSKKCIGKTMLV